MKSLKKHATGATRLHAALAETDPSSIDLILVQPPRTCPALRLPALACPPLFKPAPHTAVAARPRRGPAPSRRQRCAVLPF